MKQIRDAPILRRSTYIAAALLALAFAGALSGPVGPRWALAAPVLPGATEDEAAAPAVELIPLDPATALRPRPPALTLSAFIFLLLSAELIGKAAAHAQRWCVG